MTVHEKRRWHKLRDQLKREHDPVKAVDIMLALDRILVEVSMRMYHLPGCDRLVMRRHNRRLHKAVRNSLPRLLESSRQKV
jgi:hypothetical protein